MNTQCAWGLLSRRHRHTKLRLSFCDPLMLFRLPSVLLCEVCRFLPPLDMVSFELTGKANRRSRGHALPTKAPPLTTAELAARLCVVDLSLSVAQLQVAPGTRSSTTLKRQKTPTSYQKTMVSTVLPLPGTSEGWKRLYHLILHTANSGDLMERYSAVALLSGGVPVALDAEKVYGAAADRACALLTRWQSTLGRAEVAGRQALVGSFLSDAGLFQRSRALLSAAIGVDGAASTPSFLSRVSQAVRSAGAALNARLKTASPDHSSSFSSVALPKASAATDSDSCNPSVNVVITMASSIVLEAYCQTFVSADKHHQQSIVDALQLGAQAVQSQRTLLTDLVAQLSTAASSEPTAMAQGPPRLSAKALQRRVRFETCTLIEALIVEASAAALIAQMMGLGMMRRGLVGYTLDSAEHMFQHGLQLLDEAIQHCTELQPKSGMTSSDVKEDHDQHSASTGDSDSDIDKDGGADPMEESPSAGSPEDAGVLLLSHARRAAQEHRRRARLDISDRIILLTGQALSVKAELYYCAASAASFPGSPPLMGLRGEALLNKCCALGREALRYFAENHYSQSPQCATLHKDLGKAYGLYGRVLGDVSAGDGQQDKHAVKFRYWRRHHLLQAIRVAAPLYGAPHPIVVNMKRLLGLQNLTVDQILSQDSDEEPAEDYD